MAPSVVNRDPGPDEEVGKHGSLRFSISDPVSVNLATVVVDVDGQRVYSAGAGFHAGWSGSTLTADGSVNGCAVALAPDRRWASGQHGVRVRAADGLGSQCDVAWSFNGPTRPFVFTIYPFIFDGTRKADEDE